MNLMVKKRKPGPPAAPRDPAPRDAVISFRAHVCVRGMVRGVRRALQRGSRRARARRDHGSDRGLREGKGLRGGAAETVG